MRVSTVIRDYVRNQVEEIYKVKKENVSKDYETKKDALIKKCQKEVEKLNKKLMDIVKEEGFKILYSDSVVTLSTIENREVLQKIAVEKRALDDECFHKWNEILARLELGATKEDLDEMIKELKKESK